MAENKKTAEKDVDIGWHRFADFVDSLSYCLSKYEDTKGFRQELIQKIEDNRQEVTLEWLLNACRDGQSLEKPFQQLYDLLYKHEKYEKLFSKLSLDTNLDTVLNGKTTEVLFTFSRVIRNQEFMKDSLPVENQVNYLRKAFMYRSLAYFLSKKLQDSYRDYLFSVLDWQAESYPEGLFDLPEEVCDSLKAFYGEVAKEINVQESLSPEVSRFIPKLKEIFEQIRSRIANESEASTSKSSNFPNSNELFVSNKIHIEESWKSKGRAFVANDSVEPRERMFEESPFAHIIYDPQRRCEHCGKFLIKIENYDSEEENGNGLQISSFFPSFSRDCLIYCDISCALNNRKSQTLSVLRPLMFELGVAALPLKSILEGETIESRLKKWTLFNENPKKLEEESRNEALTLKLMNHIGEHDKENLASYALIAAFVVHSFEHQFCLLDSDFVAEFGKSFLHQLLTLSTNVITIQDQVEDNPVMIGVGLYPNIAILNHSCKPNLVPIFSGTRLILETTSPIVSGEEALFCYDTDLKSMDLSERQKYFRENYFFECDCIACENNQRDYSEALVCNFKPKDEPACRKAAFVKGDKIVCRNKPPHEVPLTEEVPERIEKIDERYKFGNRMSQIFDQSEEADDATQAFLALNEAAKLAQQHLHPLHELSLCVNRAMIKIYTSMGHYSRAIAHSEFLISTFRSYEKLSWIDLQHEIVREFDRLVQLKLLEFEDNRPTSSAARSVLGQVNQLENDYLVLKHKIGEESFESYYSGRIDKLDEYRKKIEQFL